MADERNSTIEGVAARARAAGAEALMRLGYEPVAADRGSVAVFAAIMPIIAEGWKAEISGEDFAGEFRAVFDELYEGAVSEGLDRVLADFRAQVADEIAAAIERDAYSLGGAAAIARRHRVAA